MSETWSYEPSRRDANGRVISPAWVRGPENARIATGDFSDFGDEAMRQVAALPDLLNASRLALIWLRKFSSHQDAGARMLIEELRAAILKAEGSNE